MAEQTIDLQIDGMKSRECALKLESALSAASGVRRAVVSYGTRRGRVVVDPASEVSDLEARLIEIVEAKGFTATAIGRAS